MALQQTLQDDPKLLKEKLRLLEQDRKQFFESSQQQLKANREAARQLRQENKELAQTIAAARKGTGTVLEKEARQLDDGIYKFTLNVDELRDNVADKKQQLAKLREMLRDVDTESQPLLTEDHPLTRKIRLLENRLDKSLIKFNEAVSIKKTYEQIVKRLREERVGFDNQLAAIERTLRAKDHDYQELLKMSHDANHAKEVAKKELQDFKTAFDEERRQKDRELTERKAYVQAKVEQTQKLERKEKQLRQQEQEEARQRADEDQSFQASGKRNLALTGGRDMGSSAEEEERLAQYEAAFRAIKDATGVADVQDVLQKFVSQEDTHRSLQAMVRESQARIDQLNIEKAELVSRLEELRYSGSGQLGSRRIVEEFEIHLNEANNQTRVNAEKYESLAKLLISVKGGVEHLIEKLSVFRSEMAPPPVTDDTLVEALKHCEQKLVNLADEVVPSEGAEDALVTTTMELPVHNRRVKLPRDEDEEEEDEDAAMHEEQDDDAVLKRDQVKKISANSIQRETKKQKRKRRDQ